MYPLRIKLLTSYIAIGMALAASASAAPTNVTTGQTRNGTPVATVRQEVASFADRFGKPVILRGALNLNAPISVAYSQGVSSDEAVTALARAAGGYAVRVYFVSPSSGVGITLGSAATRLVGNRGTASMSLQRVPARAAIEAVAAADDAEVKFPNGVPTGTVTFSAESIPLSAILSRVAARTNTHWTLGYVIESARPSSPSLADQEANANTSGSDSNAQSNWPKGAVVRNLPPLKPLARDAEGNILPFTIHVAPPQTVDASTAGLTPQQIAFLQQQQQNAEFAAAEPGLNPMVPFQTGGSADFFNGPSTMPGVNDLDGGIGAVNTVVPNGAQSGFALVPSYGYGY